MLVFKRILLFLVLPLFTLLLFSAASTTNVVRVVGTPAPVKSILADSGIYDSVLTGLLNQSETVSNGGDSTSLKDSAIKVAAEKTFTPAFIQANTEKVLDSVYKWLDGSGTQPDFQIDLTSTKVLFAENAAIAVQEKLTAFPPCPPGTATPQDFDVDTATCLPAGVNIAEQATKVRQNIAGGKGFLDHPVITASSIKSGESGKTIFEDKLSKAPDAYKAGKNAPYALAALALIFAIFIVLLSPTKRKGLRRAGMSLIFVGVIMLGMGFGINWAAKHQVPDVDLNNVVLQNKVKDLIVILGKKVGTNYLQFGAGYAITGVGLVTGTIFINKGKPGKKDDLEGEGKTAEDRIELKEPVKATAFDDDETSGPDDFEDTPGSPPSPKKKPTPKQTAKPATKPPKKKIIIQ